MQNRSKIYLTGMLLILLSTLTYCLKRNVLRNLESQRDQTQNALYLLEEGSGGEAVSQLENLLSADDRKVLDDPNSTIVEKKDALVRSWGKRNDRDTLYSIYALSAIKREGISLLKVTALLVAGDSQSKEDVISSVISKIPFDKKTIQSLDLFMILTDLITTPKSAPILIKEALIITINLAARIAILDTEGSGKITKANIERMSSEQADEIYKVLDKAATTMKRAYELNNSDLNAKINTKISEIQSKLESSKGDSHAEKTKTYLTNLLEKNGPIVLSSFLQTYVSKGDAPRISPKNPFQVPHRTELEDKFKFYISSQKLDTNGWITDTKCDGLLFNSLNAVAGASVDIASAQDKSTGQWFRHPLKDCYPKESGSTISRDMLIGLAIWIWHTKNLESLNKLIQYGNAHKDSSGDWIMGEEVEGGHSVALNLAFRELLLAMKDSLEGKALSNLSDEILTIVEGFEAHLQVLHFYLQGRMFNGINETQLSLITLYFERDPKNALFAYLYHLYVDGDMTDAVQILLTTKYFPNPRLPASEDRCEFYLWQRSSTKNGWQSDDWLPCAEKKLTHSGVDFLFVASRLLE